MKLLYLAAGAEHTTSQMRARALRRCGHEVEIIDMTRCMPRTLWPTRLHFWTGFLALDRPAARLVERTVQAASYDAVWVDNGTVVGPRCMAVLRRRATTVINYNLDDPTGRRDGNRWWNFLRTVPDYDLMVTVRRETEAELLARGARRVLRVFRSYDEVEHAPIELTAEEKSRWASEVLFVGTWMPERSTFFRGLVAAGVPLTIYGDHWHRSPEWAEMKSLWRGPAVYGRDYVAAIQSAKVCLGLVSKGNRDLHTQRSTEIPAIGTALLADRTAEHEELFVDREHAVLWSDAESCARGAAELLANPPRRLAMARAAGTRVRALGLGNESVMARVLVAALGE